MELTAQPLVEHAKRGVPRACPVCGSTAARTVFANRMAVCAGYDFSAPILLCSHCDCGYAGTALSAHDLGAYYSDLSKYDTLSTNREISSLDRERAAMAVAFLAPLMGSLACALDVGCSAGVLLAALRDAGVSEVIGIDPAAQAAEVARSLFNVTVTRARAETYRDYGNFDLVCLMAVLEHLLDPRALLKEVARQLKPGARLLVEIPDAGAFDRPSTHEPLEPFGEFSNEHINYFSIGDVRRLAHAVGLEVERWRPYRSANGAPGLFALLHQSRPAPALRQPDSGSPPTRVSTGDSLLRYVERSRLVMAQVESRLSEACRGAVLVYGAGNHTCRLMVQSPSLANCRVPAVFDRNHHLHGVKIGNSPVLPPEKITEFPDLPIVVSTFNARREIQATLSAATSQPVIALYH
jgi:SAM-dependent methyltransferase